MGANPQGVPEPMREMYLYIHNVYANFFKDTLDYFSMHLNPRFEHRVVGTYDKAVEYIEKTCQYGREANRPNLPALILNPTGEFDLADANAGGKQLWRFPNLAPGMIKRIFDPIYRDDNVLVNVGFIRMQGDIELIMMLNSFYEYCDMRMMMLQIFGGYERWIYPDYFTTFIILPESFINYTYENPYTGESYNLDWEKFGAYEKLVKTTAQNELVVPCNIKPTFKLTSVSDASTRYGGTDTLADWRLGATIHYEIEIPSYLVLNSDWLFKKMDFTLQADSSYSVFGQDGIPDFMIKGDTTNIDSTCEITMNTPEELDYALNNRYYHTITQAEIDTGENVVIIMPETIEDNNELIVHSKYGQMNYGDHYYLNEEGTELTIRVDTVDLSVGMIIELYVYRSKKDGL